MRPDVIERLFSVLTRSSDSSRLFSLRDVTPLDLFFRLWNTVDRSSPAIRLDRTDDVSVSATDGPPADEPRQLLHRAGSRDAARRIDGTTGAPRDLPGRGTLRRPARIR